MFDVIIHDGLAKVLQQDLLRESGIRAKPR